MKTKKQLEKEKKHRRLIAAFIELDAQWKEGEKESRTETVWVQLEKRFGYSRIHIQRILSANGIDYKNKGVYEEN